MNVTVGDSDSLPAGNKARPVKTVKKPLPETEKKKNLDVVMNNSQCVLVTPAISKRRDQHKLAGVKNLSMYASCSSDASSTDSSTYSSGASSSRKVARHVRKKQVGLKIEKVRIDALAVPVELLKYVSASMWTLYFDVYLPVQRSSAKIAKH
jgi:DNA-3-methyladenine glycosylase I